MADERKILIVEDQEDDVILIRRALRKGGIAACVQVIRDGDEAIDYFSGHGEFQGRPPASLPAVVLLDLKLPGRSGFDVLDWIRRHEALASLPVVVFTNSVEDVDIEKAYALGANSYLRKPYTMAETTALMKTVGAYWLECNQRPSAPRRLP